MLIHIGSNDIIFSKQNDLNVNDIVQRIIYIGLYCRECVVKDVIISSVLVKRSFHLTRIIRQINDLLSEYYVSNNVNNVGNNILAENVISYVNEFVLTKSNSF